VIRQCEGRTIDHPALGHNEEVDWVTIVPSSPSSLELAEPSQLWAQSFITRTNEFASLPLPPSHTSQPPVSLLCPWSAPLDSLT